jgi:alpha-beta hydrolase superfamily lysophospholipase
MLTTQSPPRDVVIPSTGGVSLRGWHWTRPSPRALLVISHGFGEHGGGYRHVAEALGPALEVDVLAPDFRGHGRSPGRRGVVRTYGDLVSDLRSTLDWAAGARPDLPRYVLGHSNGGQVALRVTLEVGTELAGLILSNPSLRVATRVPRYKLGIGRFLLRYAPNVTLKASIPPGRLTRDPAMQHEHLTDPLRHSRMSAPLFFGMVEGGALVAARAADIRQPTLIVLGTSDDVIDPAATRAVFERLGSTDKTLLIYPKMLHEPLNELGREQVLSDITAWLAHRLDRPPA